MRRSKGNGRFTLEEKTVTQHGVTYRTFLVRGWINGVRVRRQFKSRDEAMGEKNRLEVQAANTGEIVARNTRLSAEQLAEAEAAFAALGGRSLAQAVEWFRANYRPPVTEKPIVEATKAFLAERAQHVRPVVLRNYRHTMKAIDERFARRCVHEIRTADVEAFLASRKIGKKRFNNLRGELHTFFVFCLAPSRAWIRENPAAGIPWFKVSRGLPEILTADRVREVMAYVESYTGGPRSKLPPGCLVPYFALCFFAGLRPSVKTGEIAKLARAQILPSTGGCGGADIGRFVDLALGVIRVSPEISKVKGVRQIKIRPNLAAWLERYPLSRLPILPKNARRMINHVRHKFGIQPDVPRHTFISMHVAKWKSMGDAALEAGNSEAMIKRHYFNLVGEASAETFWQIAPALRDGTTL